MLICSIDNRDGCILSVVQGEDGQASFVGVDFASFGHGQILCHQIDGGMLFAPSPESSSDMNAIVAKSGDTETDWMSLGVSTLCESPEAKSKRHAGSGESRLVVNTVVGVIVKDGEVPLGDADLGIGSLSKRPWCRHIS
ncbi:hypothetical protein K0651_08040 [Ornithinimicrobium sp. Arc0846-15]|nr:hypothetical protein [Ornithinimicrobium laminariae]